MLEVKCGIAQAKDVLPGALLVIHGMAPGVWPIHHLAVAGDIGMDINVFALLEKTGPAQVVSYALVVKLGIAQAKDVLLDALALEY